MESPENLNDKRIIDYVNFAFIMECSPTFFFRFKQKQDDRFIRKNPIDLKIIIEKISLPYSPEN